MTISFSNLLHNAAGTPSGQWPLIACDDYCATCASKITSGVSTQALVSNTFSRQSEFLRFGSHVCEHCAWLYSYPKETHRNVIVAGDQIWWPMISAESSTEERPQWLSILQAIQLMPPYTLIAGVLTTDPKPRLWPLANVTTRVNFGLYVHCLDWDLSQFLYLDLDVLLNIAAKISDLLKLGFNKSDCKFGLLRSKIVKKSPAEAFRLESEIKKLRDLPEFIPALLVAHK